MTPATGRLIALAAILVQGPRLILALLAADRCREVVRRTGLSRATIYRLMASGEFPQQHQLSRGRVGWSEEEIESWLRQRLDGQRR